MRRDNVRLYREGRWTTDGRMLVDTRLPLDPIPLLSLPTPDSNYDGVLVCGAVQDVHRGRRGWVLGTVTTWRTDDVDPDFTGFACQAEFAQATTDHDERDRLVMRNARLESVMIGQSPCWKGMWIK